MESLKNNITVSFKWKIHHVQRHRDSRKGATSEYPATDTPSLNLQVRGWINIKLSATVVRSVLLKCYRGPQSRSGWISYGVSV